MSRRPRVPPAKRAVEQQRWRRFGRRLNFGNSVAGRRTRQGGLEEPVDEFRLTAGSGFVENVLRVGTRRQLGDLEARGGGGKAVSGDDFPENTCLGGGQPEP